MYKTGTFYSGAIEGKGAVSMTVPLRIVSETLTHNRSPADQFGGGSHMIPRVVGIPTIFIEALDPWYGSPTILL